MHAPTAGSNSREKSRLRDAIADEVKRYLERGGSITVLDSPASEKHPFRAPSWSANEDIDLLLD